MMLDDVLMLGAIKTLELILLNLDLPHRMPPHDFHLHNDMDEQEQTREPLQSNYYSNRSRKARWIFYNMGRWKKKHSMLQRTHRT